eukprot:CAMPEP_0178853274 /NCGR_PEP_ID=MMETSP0746-20121128/22134_1 /TAXON_ID=913974 /ORGANISM="Nitzschia punctata, Strain CCMP561" /LENGTH=78 /DNA_ID=CAMNT_0020519027 /DNA_START=1 /DNA_END=234 /DNA_ORIENTATION=-
MVLHYDLLPEEMANPDIIINAHSTNEMHQNTIKEAQERNQSHWDAAFFMTQTFIRTVLKTKCMHRVDDEHHVDDDPPP